MAKLNMPTDNRSIKRIIKVQFTFVNRGTMQNFQNANDVLMFGIYVGSYRFSEKFRRWLVSSTNKIKDCPVGDESGQQLYADRHFDIH